MKKLVVLRQISIERKNEKLQNGANLLTYQVHVKKKLKNCWGGQPYHG